MWNTRRDHGGGERDRPGGGESFRRAGRPVHVCDIDAAAVRPRRLKGSGDRDRRLRPRRGRPVDRRARSRPRRPRRPREQRRHRRPDGARRGRRDGEWERCLAIGVTSHYRTCARVAPAMKAARAGSIINISSTAGQYGIGMRAPVRGRQVGGHRPHQDARHRARPLDVRANAICPGSVDGDRMRGVIDREARHRGASSEACRARVPRGPVRSPASSSPMRSPTRASSSRPTPPA